VNRCGQRRRAGAARRRVAELLPGHVTRIVLFSDGHQTSGDVDDAGVAPVGGWRVPVFTEPMAARGAQRHLDRSHRAARRMTAGALVTATVEIGSQRATPAMVELRIGREGARQSAPCRSTWASRRCARRDVARAPGAEAIEAVVTAPGESARGQQIRCRAKRRAHARPHVLYVESAAGERSSYLQGALDHRRLST
jgi:hypothetical protein